VGSQPFQQLVREFLGEKAAAVVLEVLDRWTPRATADAGETDPAAG
jgi:hypothetical protein